ncbi:hypothetical protein F5Y17DRAFT_141498 [Xylariaceae sp. FL0594]|nr:hypothetical protein F5Y17DRAFT_141498 [Xylariaceae sp. FL0594]
MPGPEKPGRPRLSLQTKPSHGIGHRTRAMIANADPKSPTAFNTLSNVYVTAIERSTPTQSTPVTAIRLPQSLKLQTDQAALRSHQTRVQTPYAAVLPDTPLSANPTSPAAHMDIVYPSVITATPPLSAGAVDPALAAFSFSPVEARCPMVPSSPDGQTRRRVNYAGFGPSVKAPYTRNRSLHSILRNSPLPSSAKSPVSPRRQSLRLQERAARRVGYESPLTQTITTERYTRSHIDLLAEEASPYTPSPLPEDSDMVLDLAMAYSGQETRDGGQTPGPFEEMRRRMTNLATETPILSPRQGGVRKQRRKEKKRKWVWTIGKEDEADTPTEDLSTPKAVPRTAGHVLGRLAKSATPEPITAIKISSWERPESESESDLTTTTEGDRMDLEMSETSSLYSSRATTPSSVILDMRTPTVPLASSSGAATEWSSAKRARLSSVERTAYEAKERRDTPIPPDMAAGREDSNMPQ